MPVTGADTNNRTKVISPLGQGEDERCTKCFLHSSSLTSPSALVTRQASHCDTPLWGPSHDPCSWRHEDWTPLSWSQNSLPVCLTPRRHREWQCSRQLMITAHARTCIHTHTLSHGVAFRLKEIRRNSHWLELEQVRPQTLPCRMCPANGVEVSRRCLSFTQKSSHQKLKYTSCLKIHPCVHIHMHARARAHTHTPCKNQKLKRCFTDPHRQPSSWPNISQ